MPLFKRPNAPASSTASLVPYDKGPFTPVRGSGFTNAGKEWYGADDYEHLSIGDDDAYSRSEGFFGKDKQQGAGKTAHASAFAAGVAAAKKATAPAAPVPAAPAGTGKRAVKAAKKAQEAAKETSMSSEQRALKDRLLGSLTKDAELALSALCCHDGGEQNIKYKPLVALLQSLEAEGVCSVSFGKDDKILVRGAKGGSSQRIIRPSQESRPVLLSSVAFLRRMLQEEDFPVDIFAE